MYAGPGIGRPVPFNMAAVFSDVAFVALGLLGMQVLNISGLGESCEKCAETTVKYEILRLCNAN